MTVAALEVEGLVASYDGRPVLRGIDLAVGAGEIVSILGPSGCGKSTLLRAVAGLVAADRGCVRIGGRAVDGVEPRDRGVAMVFQSYALYPHMTVAQNVALPLMMRRMTRLQRLPLLGRLMPGSRGLRAGIARDVARVASAVRLDGLLDRRPAQLSGGQKQRVALARALVRDPVLFLLDEPLSNVDVQLRASVRDEILDLRRRSGVAMLFVTHDQSEAMAMSDRVALMADGRILQSGSPAEVYDAPASLEAARLLGSPPINVLPTEVVAEGAGLAFEPSRPGVRPAWIAFRPERCRVLVGAGGVALSTRRIERLGAETILRAETAHGVPVSVRLPGPGAALPPETFAVAPGPEGWLAFDAEGAACGRVR
jgi:multiple sugar transport system ATP-binding protein